MTLRYAADLRNAKLDSITTFVGNAALLRIYDGTQPATGGTPTTLLAELVCGTPFAAAASAGVLTLGAVTQDPSANATGTATWFRLVKADGTTHCFDGTCGTSGADLNLTTTSIVSGQPVQILSASITDGNP